MNYQDKIKYLLLNKNEITFEYPFKHFVIENFFNESDLEGLCEEEILIKTKGKISKFNNDKELKIGISPIQDEENKVIKVLNYLNSDEFVNFLEKLTEIIRTSPGDSLTSKIDKLSNYYKNLTSENFKNILNFENTFTEYEFKTNNTTHDLYFYGVKR